MRLIDADALKKHYAWWEDDRQKLFDSIVDSQPTVDAVPVRHGKWIPCAKNGLILTEQMRLEGNRWYGFKCSACNFVRKGNAPRDANYCECCGARMDEE